MRYTNDSTELSNAINDLINDLETITTNDILLSKRKIDPLVFNTINGHGKWETKITNIKILLSDEINNQSHINAHEKFVKSEFGILSDLIKLMRQRSKDWEDINPRLCGWLDGTQEDLSKYINKIYNNISKLPKRN